MRLGEINRIKTADVDVAKRTVIVRQRKDPKNKENNDQVVPLLGNAWTIVERRMTAFPGHLFPYTETAIDNNFRRTCKHCGIEGLRFHDLRHCLS